MMSKVVCCDECFARIGARSTSAAKVWLELCKLKAESGIFGLKTDDFPELRILELMEFIITTETSNLLLVKVKGSQDDYFCAGGCDGDD